MTGPYAGALRDKVTIETPPTEVDNYGQPVGDWVKLKTRACSIEPITGKEIWTAGLEAAINTVRVRFRYEPNILKSGYRLVNHRTSPATVYEIEGQPINPGNENRQLICMCTVREL